MVGAETNPAMVCYTVSLCPALAPKQAACPPALKEIHVGTRVTGMARNPSREAKEDWKHGCKEGWKEKDKTPKEKPGVTRNHLASLEAA